MSTLLSIFADIIIQLSINTYTLDLDGMIMLCIIFGGAWPQLYAIILLYFAVNKKYRPVWGIGIVGIGLSLMLFGLSILITLGVYVWW